MTKKPANQRFPSRSRVEVDEKRHHSRMALKAENISGRQLELSDLDDHNCLVDILTKLNIVDLLSVADTSQQMRAAAEVALWQKYTRHLDLCVEIRPRQYRSERLYSFGRNNRLWSSDVRFLLRFFRCFGQSVCQLELWSLFGDVRAPQVIFEYANRYASVSLKKFAFENCLKTCLDLAKRPFVNVDKVLVNCKISKERFKWLFPKAQTIKFRISEFSCLEQHLPELSILNLDVFFSPEKRKDQEMSITECFRRNPQLRELKFNIPIDNIIDLVRRASELLSSLECLHITVHDDYRLMDPSRSKTVHFKNVKTFRLDYYRLDTIPLTFEDLKHFEFLPSGMNDQTYTQQVYDFIRKNPTIETLTSWKEFFAESNISQIFPSINEVIICNATELTMKEVAALMNKLHTINTFNFICDSSRPIKDFEALCGNKWQLYEKQLEKTDYCCGEKKEINMRRTK